MQFGVAGLIPHVLKVQAKVTLSRLGSYHKSGEWAKLCVDQCVCAFRAMEVPELVCLRSSCNHVTEVVVPYSWLKSTESYHAK